MTVPAAITHGLMGWDVLRKMDLRFEDDLFTQFMLGTQGPDIFYFNPFSKKMRAFAAEAHERRVGDFVVALARYCRQHKEDKGALAYALGFVCHVALDRLAHPYINHFVQLHMKEGERESEQHKIFEAELDYAILFDLTKHSPLSFLLHEITPEYRPGQKACAQIWESLSPEVYGRPIKARAVHKSIDWFRTSMELIVNKDGKQAARLHRLERIFRGGRRSLSALVVPFEDSHRDTLNTQKRPWPRPYGPEPESDMGFVELYWQSVEEGVALCRRFQEAVESGQPPTRAPYHFNLANGLLLEDD